MFKDNNDFAESIKQKYPAYKDIPNDQLAQKMLDKYPQYKSQITGAPANPPSRSIQQMATDEKAKSMNFFSTLSNNVIKPMTTDPAMGVATMGKQVLHDIPQAGGDEIDSVGRMHDQGQKVKDEIARVKMEPDSPLKQSKMMKLDAIQSEMSAHMMDIMHKGVIDPKSHIGAALGMAQSLGKMPGDVAKLYSKKYGSWDAIKKTAQTDPGGTAADLFALIMLIKGGAGLIKGKTPGAVPPAGTPPAGAPPITEAPVNLKAAPQTAGSLAEVAPGMPEGTTGGFVGDASQVKTPLSQATTTEQLMGSKLAANNPPQNLVTRVVSTAKNFVRPVDFIEKVRAMTHEVKSDVVKGWSNARESLIKANPNKIIDASDAFESTIDNLGSQEVNPKLSKIVNSIPELKNIIDNPDAASKLTLTQTNDLISKIKLKVPANEWKAMENKSLNYRVNPEWYDVKNLVNDIKASETQAFPEWKGVRAKYADVAEAYKKLRPKVKMGGAIDKLRNGMGDAEIRKLVRKYYPPEIAEQIRDYHTAWNMLKLAGLAVVYEKGKGALGL